MKIDSWILTLIIVIVLIVVFTIILISISANQKKKEYQYREEQRELAYKDASKKFETWKLNDLELLRRQILETTNKYFLVQFEKWKFNETTNIRQDAIQKSHSVISGKISEHLIPFFPNFPYNPKDARFIGSPIDLIVFDGMDEGQLKNVVFMEIKTGTSTLTSRERQVRDAVLNHRIEWKEINSNFLPKVDNHTDTQNTTTKNLVQNEQGVQNTERRIKDIIEK